MAARIRREMADESDPESDQPQPQRRQHRIEIQRQLKHPRDEAAPEDAARSSFPPRDEEKPTASLETGEQEAAASREQVWGEQQNEPHEMRRADRAQRTSTRRRSNGDCGSSDSDSLGGPGQQASIAESGLRSTEPEEVNNSHDNGGTRWVSQQDLEKLIPPGIILLQSEATDAIFYLNERGEKVWVVDKNGDCVIGQTKNVD